MNERVFVGPPLYRQCRSPDGVKRNPGTQFPRFPPGYVLIERPLQLYSSTVRDENYSIGLFIGWLT